MDWMRPAMMPSIITATAKRLDAPYRRARSRTWLKNPFGEAVRREREEEWN
jgi:hypothetical protein